MMPPLGLLLGGVDFTDLFITLKQGAVAGPYPTLAAAVFMLVKNINKLQREQPAPKAEPTTKDYPRCFTAIPIKATRCPHCTSELSATF